MHARHARHARQRGVTLVELIIGLVILSIILSFAIPSFSQMVASQRVKAATSDLYTSLMRARSEAIKRNADVRLVPVGGNWANGWKVENPADTTRPLEAHDAVAKIAITGPAAITYRGNGRLRATATPQLGVSATGTDTKRCISADLSGRPYLKSSAC